MLAETSEEGLKEFQPSRLIDFALDCLKERESRILQRRFGLFGAKRETLEEIGQSEDVTRERIRQIEKKGLDKLKSARFKRVFEEIIRNQHAVIQRLFLGEDECGELGDIVELRRALPSDLRLAFEIVYPRSDGLKQYLEGNYECIDQVFFPKSKNRQTLERDINRLDECLGRFVLPRTITYLSNHLDIAGFAVSIFAARS